MPANTRSPEGVDSAKKRQRRSRSRQPGSIQEYPTREGKRWRFQIYVLKDPEYPELGSRRLTRSGFASTEEANDALQDALKQRKQNEKFSGKVPAIGAYADEWVAGLKLADSTIKGYKKIISNHITPQLGEIRLDKLTATRIARHYRDLEKHGRADKIGKGQPLSANSVHKVHVVLGAILCGAIAPLVVLEPANAAIAAAKILGLADPAIAERVNAYRAAKYEAIIAADKEHG